MIRILCVFVSLFLGLSAQANPLRTTYQAKIVKPDGHPLESSNVSFRFSILDPSASCVLYVEDFSAINMTDSGGLISFSLGAGVRSFPTSGTSQTFADTFNNATTSFSCQTPGIYTPASHDNRKVVMQFNDGPGWQTLPAMIINAVPYSMYAWKADNSTTLNGKADTAFVEYSTIPTCTASQALRYNGASFSCVSAGGGGGVSYTVTSSDVTTALGYTPAAQASFTTVTSTVTSLGGSVTTLTSLANAHTTSLTALASQVAGIVSSQWSTSGSAVYYNSGNVGIGTNNPTTALTVNGQVTFQNGAGVGIGAMFNNAGALNLQANSASTGLEVGTSSANPISLYTNGIPRVTVNGSGNLGVGTSAPTAVLDVISTTNPKIATFTGGATGVNQNVIFQVLNNNASAPASSNLDYAMITADTMKASGTTGGIALLGLGEHYSGAYGNANEGVLTAGNKSTGLFINNRTTGDIRFGASAVEHLRIRSVNGYIGIGTSTPVTRLDVSGGVRISMESAACAVSYAGTLRYSGSNVEYCNGLNWQAFGVAGSVTSSSVISALGYTPANSATVTALSSSLSTSVTGLTASASAMSSSISSLSASMASIVSSQWLTSGTAISYSSGFVGIGTANPAKTFQLESNAPSMRFRNTSANYNWDFVTNSNSNQYLSLQNNSGITVAQFQPTFVDMYTSLGVGSNGSATSPNSRDFFLSVGSGSNGQFPGMVLVPASNYNTNGSWEMMLAASSGATNNFQINNGTTPRLVIDSTGKVGLGTSATTYPLTVSGTIASLSGGFRFPDSTTQTTAYVSGAAAIAAQLGYVPASSASSTQWGESGSNIYYTTGSVGIGTSGPGDKLDVAGDMKVRGSSWSTTGDKATLKLGNTGWDYIEAELNGPLKFRSAQPITFGHDLTGGEQVRITNTGLVGIGTSNPTQTLDVNGIARVQSWLNVGLTPTTQNAGDALIINQSGSSAKFRMHANSGGSQPTDGFSILTDTTNTTMLNNESGYLALGSSQTASVFIRGANGYVGVGAGNSVPLYALDVSGVVRSSSGGFRFPDNSVQTTAATGSQWTNVTGGINYTGGWVGINAVPKVPLTVNYDNGVYSFTYLDIPSYAGAVISASGPAETASGVTKPVLVLSRQNQSSWSSVARFELGRHSTTANANTMLNIKLSDRGIANEGDNAPTVMTMFSTGKVGIGDTTPTSTLTVGGNIEMSSGKLIFADGTSQTTAAVKPIYFTYNNTVTVNAAGNSSGTITTTSWVAPTTGTVMMTYTKIMPYVFSCTAGNFGISLRVNSAAGTLNNQAFISAINRYAGGEVAFPPIIDMWAVTAGTTYTITTEYFAQNFSSCTINTRGNSMGKDILRIEYQ